MPDMMIEWAPFILAEGATIDQLLQASEDLQAGFLARQPGFVSRVLLHAGGNAWCDLVYWESREAAERAMQAAATSPVCVRYFQLMAGADHAEPGGGVRLLALRRLYQRQPARTRPSAVPAGPAGPRRRSSRR